MSFREVGAVLDHSPYKLGARLVHIVLAERANEDNGWELWYSVPTVARKAGVSESTVRSTLAQMVRDGYLERLEEIPGKPTRYRFVIPGAPLQNLDPSKSLPQTPPNRETTLLISQRRSKGAKTTAPEVFPIGGDLAKWTLTVLRAEVISDTRDEFLNHHRAKGTQFVDWSAAWRTWARRAIKFDPTLAAVASAPPPIDNHDPDRGAIWHTTDES